LCLNGFSGPVPLGLQCSAKSPFAASVIKRDVTQFDVGEIAADRRCRQGPAHLDRQEQPVLRQNQLALLGEFQAGREGGGQG